MWIRLKKSLEGCLLWYLFSVCSHISWNVRQRTSLWWDTVPILALTHSPVWFLYSILTQCLSIWTSLWWDTVPVLALTHSPVWFWSPFLTQRFSICHVCKHVGWEAPTVLCITTCMTETEQLALKVQNTLNYGSFYLLKYSKNREGSLSEVTFWCRLHLKSSDSLILS